MAAHAEVLTTGRFDTRRAERVFYSTMALVVLIIVFAGFSRTFYIRPYFQTEKLQALLIAHGVIFSAWIALFITQTTLVAAKRTRIHMKLGIAGMVLAASMVIIGSIVGIVRAKLIALPPGFTEPLVFLTIPLGDMVVFAILVGAAFYYRRKADIHKRLMLLSTITILPAAVARLPFDFILQYGPLAFFGIPDLLIIPMIIFDLLTRGKPHRATILGGLLLVISHPLRVPIGNTEVWLAFARWITQWS
jgi:hypothetical protein